MAFPLVESRTVGGSPNISNSTTHVINLPSSPGAGNLLLVIMGSDGNPTVSTTSPGWVKLGQSSDNAADNVSAFAGVAGTAGDLTVTSAPAENTAHVVYEVSNWSGAVGDVASAFRNAGGTRQSFASPPPLTPPGGELDYLWFTGSTARVSTNAPTGPAPGFSDFIMHMSGSPNSLTRGFVGTCLQSLRADSMQPGDIPHGGFDDWAAFTIAIPPPSEAVNSGGWFQFF